MTTSGFPVWGSGWRDRAWVDLDQEWDLIIIGGGITGAGLLNEAGCHGWKALLVEEKDFAWGTSSRSSKLIHGGMRYIRQGKLGMIRSLLLERDTLLNDVPGLVDPLPFVLPTHSSRRLERWQYRLGVTLYDWLRGKGRSWRWLSADEMHPLLPGVDGRGFEGGFLYLDAVTEDARLVLRVIREGVAKGGLALNYARAVSFLKDGGEVVGIELRDELADREIRLRGQVVVNAAGIGGDGLREALGGKARLRPLRGAHLVIPKRLLPVGQGISFRHPEDGRHLYLLPWEGTTLVGCTDLDHGVPLKLEPRADASEVRYLLDYVNGCFPGVEIRPEDLLSTFAGIRPVIGTGRSDTHNEARDSLYLEEAGLVTLISGKLTGFRKTVRNGIQRLAKRLAGAGGTPAIHSFFSQASLEGDIPLSPAQKKRFLGRYGSDAQAMVDAALPGELEEVPTTPVLWVEVRWGARAEGIIHLDDLLLRRTRLGLILPEGGKEILSRIRDICREELDWDDLRWEEEEARYLEIIRENYGVLQPSQ